MANCKAEKPGYQLFLMAVMVLSWAGTSISGQEAETDEYSVPRTADGHPDLQGFWSLLNKRFGATSTPNFRNLRLEYPECWGFDFVRNGQNPFINKTFAVRSGKTSHGSVLHLDRATGDLRCGEEGQPGAVTPRAVGAISFTWPSLLETLQYPEQAFPAPGVREWFARELGV